MGFLRGLCGFLRGSFFVSCVAFCESCGFVWGFAWVLRGFSPWIFGWLFGVGFSLSF